LPLRPLPASNTACSGDLAGDVYNGDKLVSRFRFSFYAVHSVADDAASQSEQPYVSDLE